MNDYQIESDVRCAGCGYNLCGLSADGLCPECAHPIGETLRFVELAGRQSDRFLVVLEGIRTIRTGLRFVVLAVMMCAIGVSVATWLIGQSSDVLGVLGVILGLAMLIVGLVVVLAGIADLTSSLPNESRTDTQRAFLITGSLLIPAGVVVVPVCLSAGMPGVALCSMSMAPIFITYALIRRVHVLSTLIGAPGLARLATCLGRMLLVALLIAILLSVLVLQDNLQASRIVIPVGVAFPVIVIAAAYWMLQLLGRLLFAAAALWRLPAHGVPPRVIYPNLTAEQSRAGR
ncbi:MAG: hypothetical protein JNG88_09155 [Phycisphaerales bacterium]|nr:hypothetical protein [Phycisphaerales bacterium]